MSDTGLGRGCANGAGVRGTGIDAGSARPRRKVAAGGARETRWRERDGGRLPPMREPTKDDVDALVGPATPHFAYQLRARVEELVRDLPDDHAVRRYAEDQMEMLDRLGHASSTARDSPKEPRSRLGWDRMPSAAPVYDPLPPRE